MTTTKPEGCPIDLRAVAAEHGYRSTFDESYDPFNVPYDKQDTWSVRVIGRYGDIWPHSPSKGLLGVFTTQRIGRRVLAEAEGSAADTDGDDGLLITFPIPAFARVAEIIQCYRKRVLTDEQKAVLVERGKAGRFGRAGTQGEFPDDGVGEGEEADPGAA
jgi:hypothetical protein